MDPSSERRAALGLGDEEQAGFSLMKKLTESFRNFMIWLGLLSRNPPSIDHDRASSDEAKHIAPFRYAPAVMITVVVLLGLLVGFFSWRHVIG